MRRNDPAARAAGMTLKCLAPGPDFALVGRRDGRVFRVGTDGSDGGSWPVSGSAVLGLAVSPDGAGRRPGTTVGGCG